MTVYWLIFFLPASFILFQLKERDTFGGLVFCLIGVLLVLVVGFRNEIGCDWFNYLRAFYRSEYFTGSSFDELFLVSSDIGYSLLSIGVYELGGNVVVVNFLMALLSVGSLLFFCWKQESPYTALMVAVPYIVIVFFQGYTRQSAAFGLWLLATLALVNGRFVLYAVIVFLAMLFHKSAIVLLAFPLLLSGRFNVRHKVFASVFIILLFNLVLGQHIEKMWGSYVERQSFSSEGGLIRVLMNLIPAFLFFAFRRKMYFKSSLEEQLVFWCSILTFICVPLVFFASTAVDRLALYLSFIQILIYSRLSYCMFQGAGRYMVSLSIFAFYAAIQFTWLNFANHAKCWLPYNSWLVN